MNHYDEATLTLDQLEECVRGAAHVATTYAPSYVENWFLSSGERSAYREAQEIGWLQVPTLTGRWAMRCRALERAWLLWCRLAKRPLAVFLTRPGLKLAQIDVTPPDESVISRAGVTEINRYVRHRLSARDSLWALSCGVKVLLKDRELGAELMPLLIDLAAEHEVPGDGPVESTSYGIIGGIRGRRAGWWK